MNAAASMSNVPHESLAQEITRSVVLGGLACGVLDATNGVVAFYLMYDLNPIQVLQFIASGTMGAAAFEGGLLAAGLGVVYHFVIAFVVAAIYSLAASQVRVLRDQWLPIGFVYGAAVWAVMNLIVVPNSAAAAPALDLIAVLNGVIGHGIFVGATVAWFARRIGSGCSVRG